MGKEGGRRFQPQFRGKRAVAGVASVLLVPFIASCSAESTPAPLIPIFQPAGPTPPSESLVDMRFYADEYAPILKRNIENKFQTNLITQGEVREAKSGGRLVPGHPDLGPRWSGPTLSMLEEFLPLLPAHFYQTKEDGRKIQITLTNFPSGADCYPFGFDAGKEYCRAEVSYRDFHPNLWKEAFVDLTHELVHVASPTKPLNPDSAPKDWVLTSPWYTKLGSILGNTFDNTRRALYGNVQMKRSLLSNEVTTLEKTYSLDQNLSLDEQKELFYRRLEYGLGYDAGGTGKSLRQRTLPEEFFAVLGEYYVHGKQYFLSMYSEIVPAETAKQLYEFTKSDIFRGREYQAFPTG